MYAILSADVVHGHDELYTKESGAWKLQIGDSLKLRRDTAEINRRLLANGLQIIQQVTVKGMPYVVASKPADA